MTNTKAFRLSLLALVMLLVGCDHGTKHAAQSSLARGAMELVPGVLDLRLTENHDTAFSLLSRFGVHGASTALMVLASLTVLGIAGYWFARRNVASRWEQAGLPMVLAGGLGNLIDRAVRGYVVDFIHVHRWPVFNVADIAVVAGIGVMLLTSRQATKRARAAG
jgi:signal peptidase II